MQDEHIYDLIVDYFCGNLSAEDAAQVESWRNSSQANARVFRQLRTIWMTIPDMEQLSRFDKEQAYRKFMARVEAHRRAQNTRKAVRLLRYAAVLLVLVGVFSWVFYIGGQHKLEARFADITVEAPLGSTTRMALPDGTQVWLNAGSHITYSQGFGVTDRNVRLVGEGYFEVVHNERLPFHVLSGALKVRVLGTKFDFRDYPEDSDAVVSLSEGSVALGCLNDESGREYRLSPNERAVFGKASHSMVIESCQAQNTRQWTRGVLMFSNSHLSDIATALSRSYSQRVVLADKHLGNLCFYGTFNREEQSLRQILDALSATGRIHYKTNGKTYILYR